MTRQSTVFYLSRVNTYLDQGRFGAPLHIGPAYQKLMHVAAAMRSVNLRVTVVSVPVCNELAFARAVVHGTAAREKQVPVASLGVMPGKLLSRIYAFWAFWWFVYRKVGPTDRVIFYNFFPEYGLAAIWLRLLGRPGCLDIEDGPRPDERGIVGALTRLSFRIMRSLCNRYLTVSERLVADMQLGDDTLVIYGASPLARRKEINLFSGDLSQMRVIYGGALLPETGLEIFCSAIRILSQAEMQVNTVVEVIVTGFGGEDALHTIRELKLPRWLKLTIRQDLDFQEYQDVLKSSHVGLCLKVPGTSMADTTFPSKVVEIVREGLLLISTPVSDVPQLFDGTQAILLQKPFDTSLADTVLQLAKDPARFASIAQRGHDRGIELFEYSRVGTRFRHWLARGT